MALRQSWECFEDVYELQEELGRGSYAVVNKCRHRDSQMEFAVKIFDLTKEDEEVVRANLHNEETICSLLRQRIKRSQTRPSAQAIFNSSDLKPEDRIVRLHDTIDEEDFYYFVFDLISGGDLISDLAQRDFYSEAVASDYMQQILLSVKYCHEKNVIHRDIKVANVMLATKDKGAIVKLADFGLATLVGDKEYDNRGFCGTLISMAPEIVTGKPYGKPVDIWACGVMLYLMLSGDDPFCGYRPDGEYDNNLTLRIIAKARFSFSSPQWRDVSDAAKDLITQMLNPDQYTRITAAQCLKHPWIANRETVAPVEHLPKTVESLKIFVAKRKFKGAVKGVMFANKIQNALAGKFEPAPVVEEPDEYKALKEEILQLTENVVAAITAGDFNLYKTYTDSKITSFDPESYGNLVEGTRYHKFHFDYGPSKTYQSMEVTLLSPHVYMLGENAACIAYVRLMQHVDSSGVPHSSRTEETRIWQHKDGSWQNTHFHCSKSSLYGKEKITLV